MTARPPEPDPPPDPTPIRRLIRATRRVLRSSWVATGLGLTLGLGLGALVAVVVADLLAPLSPWLRLAGLGLIVVPTLWVLVAGVVRPLLRRLAPVQVARRIEAKLPGVHNRLVSCIDLDRKGRERDRSTPFYQRLVRESLDRIRGFRPWSVADRRSLGRAALFSAASTAAFLSAFGLFPDRLPTALARILRPFADIPPASAVRFEVEPGDAKVLRGDDIPISVRITKGEPQGFRLEVRPLDRPGEVLWHDLKPRGPNRWAFTLAGFERPFAYRVHGGGTWSREHRVAMVDRPVIAGLHTVLGFPDYMKQPEPRVGPPQVADVTGPEGSTVEVVVAAKGDVAEGEIQLLATRPKLIEVAHRPERVWQLLEFPPPGAALGGNWHWDLRRRGRPDHYDPPAGGHHGHLFHNASPGFRVLPGEMLFAYVYIPRDQKPETIMLQWHDGQNWEHRAVWGEDKIPQGQPDTPSRRRVGPLPEPGGWVRLEVPAALVDMEGRELRGLSFDHFGGTAFWHRAGTVPPAFVEEKEFEVARSFPLHTQGGTWSGTFPLERDGLYRVELRNELGQASKPMKEAKVVALPDNPPQIVLERPGADLALSKPAKLPLVVSAYDDFGLEDVVVSAQKGDSGGFVGRPVRRFAGVVRNETVLAALDLTTMGLKPGEHVRYRVEARDRKGQTAQTQEYVVRIVDDGNAADRQLDAYQKSQDPFREKLAKLIAEQAKVQEVVDRLPAKYAKLEETIEAALAEARRAPAGQPKPGEPPKLPPLDPEATKLLNELRQELNQLAGQEAQNAGLGDQVAAELKQAGEQAASQKLLPPEIVAQMQAAAQAFAQQGQQPLQAQVARLRQGADANQPPPDLGGVKESGQQIARDLAAMKDRLDALARAQERLKADAEAALADLRRDRARQEADAAASEFGDLQQFLADLQSELKRLEGDQGQLLDAAAQAPDILLPDVGKKQDTVDADVRDKLADARALQDDPELRRLRRPEFPRAPYTPEPGEALLPPAEEDEADDPPASKDTNKADADPARKPADDEDEDEPLFQPALGGPRPKLDPRFKDKVRPAAKPARKEGGADSPERRELARRGEHNLQEIDLARGSLAADQQALENIMDQLRQAAPPADGAEAAEGQGEPVDDALGQLMQSPTARQALAMAARMRQLRQGAKSRSQPGQAQPAPNPAARPGLAAVRAATEAELNRLDPNTRTVILKLPPKLREELLQGLREEGPEGYGPYIQDYFKRLTEAKGPK